MKEASLKLRRVAESCGLQVEEVKAQEAREVDLEQELRGDDDDDHHDDHDDIYIYDIHCMISLCLYVI